MLIIFYINFAGKLRKLIMTPLTPIGQGRDYHIFLAAALSGKSAIR